MRCFLERRQWLTGTLGGVCLPAAAALGLSGCWRRIDDEVIVYAALDREFSGPLLARFERDRGVPVAPKYDIESTKTVGLVNALLLERDRPRCDVFWNNEILHTLRLERAGVLEPYVAPAAARFPTMFRHPDGLWYGFAARARVLLINTEQIPEAEWPRSIAAIADPHWRNRVGIAKPLFGTTATHAAVLFAVWGQSRAIAFFQAVRANAQTLSGNKQVATAVGRGQIAWGLTDTDDAIDEVENGSPVAVVYPDQAPGESGALLIPNTLSIIRGCRHRERARQLVDYLLAPAVERELALGASAQFPLNPDVTERPRVEPQPTPRWLDVDYSRAAEHWDQAARSLRVLFAT